MRLRPLAALFLVAGCENLPAVLPPGFGNGAQQQNQFFFPTGLAVAPDKTVVVANGNFGHAFAGGTMVSLRADYIRAHFDRTSGLDGGTAIDCSQPIRFNEGGVPGSLDGGLVAEFPPECDVFQGTPEFAAAFAGAVMIGNYAGPVTLDDSATNPATFAASGGTAFTGSRDTNTLNAVHIAPGGALSCADGAGSGVDCRAGLFDTADAGNLDGPFAIVAGDAALPGQGSQRVLFIGSLIPTVNAIESSIPITSSAVSVLAQGAPYSKKPLYTMLASSEFVAAGIGMSSLLYDPVRRHLVVGGCYQRFANTGAGEPASSKCVNANFNFLRYLPVDVGTANGVTLAIDLFPSIQSLDLAAMTFADPDPITSAPTTIWATLRNPDTLAKINLPLNPSVPPSVTRIVPLPSTPGQLVVIPRAGRGNVIAVASERMGALTIYDEDAQQVVANVERLGDTPYGVAVWDNDGVTARLVTSIFAGCSVALVEVPLANPSAAALRGRIGGCEE
jgi:hypothetical protein